MSEGPRIDSRSWVGDLPTPSMPSDDSPVVGSYPSIAAVAAPGVLGFAIYLIVTSLITGKVGFAALTFATTSDSPWFWIALSLYGVLAAFGAWWTVRTFLDMVRR